MKALNNTKKYVLILVLVFVIIGIFAFVSSSLNKNLGQESKNSPIITQNVKEINNFIYKGRNNKDALTLLKEETEVKQDDSGMVSSINGRAADSNKREFWSFYINGQMAQVGPADYITKDEDSIEWKIETY